MNIIGITQARIGSSRLPKKILLKINEKSLLQIHLERAGRSELVNKWIVATTNEERSDLICEIAGKLSVQSYKGSLDDVLDRFYRAVENENPDYIVRITSDCPLIDPSLIDETIQYAITHKLSYHSNQAQETYPDGLDVEIFTFQALKDAFEHATLKSEREHVTPYIRNKGNHINGEQELQNRKYSHLRITVDEYADFSLIQHLINNLGDDQPWLVYADYLLNNPSISSINQSIFKNQGYMKSKFEEIRLREITQFKASDAYRNTIHKLIPGGAHTYSKGDDQFPLLSPAAISHGKGAYVWDIDGNQYLDCSMGLTSVSLGHAYEPVLEKVRTELDKGVNFQRPSVLEKETAEKFLSLIPQHDMVKFAKNGSSVTTAAVKLARAKTGRKLVAFPGDSPFYSYDDWFIGTTPCNKGVPEEFSSLSVTFQSCNIESLKAQFEKYPDQIACVITEPEKTTCGNCSCRGNVGGFLKEAIELCHRNGALFIADEMVTGFKTGFPGSISKHGIVPDMATWGKGIANGFSFCALTGKKEVMDLGGITRTGEEKVFLISSTHGGETHAMAAALETIRIFQEENVVGEMHRKSRKLIELCQYIVKEYDVASYIQIFPVEWLPAFVFKNANGEISSGYRTLFLQEMIKRGVLFQGIFLSTLSHTDDDIYYFAKAFQESVKVYVTALKEGYEKYLVGDPVKGVFRKLL